jgi:hypothetical protein
MGRTNSYTATCYRCGGTVAKNEGFVEKVGIDQWRKWRQHFSTRWLVQHVECATRFRGTDVHYRFKPAKKVEAA